MTEAVTAAAGDEALSLAEQAYFESGGVKTEGLVSDAPESAPGNERPAPHEAEQSASGKDAEGRADDIVDEDGKPKNPGQWVRRCAACRARASQEDRSRAPGRTRDAVELCGAAERAQRDGAAEAGSGSGRATRSANGHFRLRADQRQADDTYARPDAITWMKRGALSGQGQKVMPKPGATLPAG